MKKSAFTLAEILITLTIIGIVASLTIPTIINNTSKQQYVAGLKKAYSTLNQAINMHIAEDGDVESLFYCSSYSGRGNCFIENISKYISTTKTCLSSVGECWHDDGVLKMLNNLEESNHKNHPSMITSDGMYYFISASATCNDYSNGGTSDTLTGRLKNGTCAKIWVDVNGSKSPNQVGRDTFRFYLTETGIIPSGSLNDNYVNDCTTSTRGLGCAAKVLQENAMNY